MVWIISWSYDNHWLIYQDEVRNSLKDDAQNSEKVDSGMDDDSQQSNDHDVPCKSTSGRLFVLSDITDNFNNILILEKKPLFFSSLKIELLLLIIDIIWNKSSRCVS